MLSITDLMDFNDLDRETVQVVRDAHGLPDIEATELARELLKTKNGLYLLHSMFHDQIAAAGERGHTGREKSLLKAYAYFARKYPVPGMF